MQDYFFVKWKQFLINLKTKHFEQKNSDEIQTPKPTINPTVFGMPKPT